MNTDFKNIKLVKTTSKKYFIYSKLEQSDDYDPEFKKCEKFKTIYKIINNEEIQDALYSQYFPHHRQWEKAYRDGFSEKDLKVEEDPEEDDLEDDLEEELEDDLEEELEDDLEEGSEEDQKDQKDQNVQKDNLEEGPKIYSLHYFFNHKTREVFAVKFKKGHSSFNSLEICKNCGICSLK
jgi:hypothetical protein